MVWLEMAQLAHSKAFNIYTIFNLDITNFSDMDTVPFKIK
jgi:hypothetical protein